MEEIIRLFPKEVKGHLLKRINGEWSKLEEIRLRLNQPIELIFTHKVKWLKNIILNEQFRTYILNKMSDYSLYRMETELREGFITIVGGHRIGLAGEVTMENGVVKHIQNITFFNIRIAKEVTNIAMPIMPYLKNDRFYYNTIVVGSPQTGKTSLIRDIARFISNGTNENNHKKVAIIDERSEIAASKNGIPQHDVGFRTDVMDACPKTSGMMMMIRSMSPDILIVDEIGKKADVDALLEAIYAGVNVVCTLHGHCIKQIKNRPEMKHLFSKNIFERFILLERDKQSHFIMSVYDWDEKKLFTNRSYVR